MSEEKSPVIGLAATVEDMIKLRIRRLASSEDGSFEIELHESAFQVRIPRDVPLSDPEVAKALGLDQNAEVCPCGHDLNTEHNDAGCLEGCPDDACQKQGTPIPPEAPRGIQP